MRGRPGEDWQLLEKCGWEWREGERRWQSAGPSVAGRSKLRSAELVGGRGILAGAISWTLVEAVDAMEAADFEALPEEDKHRLHRRSVSVQFPLSLCNFLFLFIFSSH